jgi:hypothetical protein
VLRQEIAMTNLTVFDLTWSRLELTINRTQGEQVNHHTTDAVLEIFSTTITNLYFY